METVAYQTPQSIGFPRQEYWNGLPLPSLGNLSNPRIIEPASPARQADCLPLSHHGNPSVQNCCCCSRYLVTKLYSTVL